jgi:hypothetical protein
MKTVPLWRSFFPFVPGGRANPEGDVEPVEVDDRQQCGDLGRSLLKRLADVGGGASEPHVAREQRLTRADRKRRIQRIAG